MSQEENHTTTALTHNSISTLNHNTTSAVNHITLSPLRENMSIEMSLLVGLSIRDMIIAAVESWITAVA